MRLSSVLRKQHIGYHFKKIWHVQGKREIPNSGSEQRLIAKGIPVYQPPDIFEEKRKVIELASTPLDENNPNWHERVCYTYNDTNVLLEGLNQAKLLTRTVEIEEELPERFSPNLPNNFNRRLQEIIFSSHLFDGEQEKLPVVKDPERPAWNFPRTYGITQTRATNIFIERLLQSIESNCQQSMVNSRTILRNLNFQFSFEQEGNLFQLRLRSDKLLCSDKPLSFLSQNDTAGFPLPDLQPIKPTITLNRENIYHLQDIYPIKSNSLHPHTIIVYHDKAEVKNLYEEPVLESQLLGRSLLKTFAVASTYARQQFGDNVKKLPQPVTVQCIQTDGRLFDFGILQLNTLDWDDDGVKNIWYKVPQIAAFDVCAYVAGRPKLEGFSEPVFRFLLGFYRNT